MLEVKTNHNKKYKQMKSINRNIERKYLEITKIEYRKNGILL